MELAEVQQWVQADVERHCRARGARPGPGVNLFVPHDSVAAYSMARLLTTERCFDHHLVVAPEGHVYGYFFEQCGVEPLSVAVGYPPTELVMTSDLSVVQGGSVLVIEDDVRGGATLRLVAEALRPAGPRRLALFLGHKRGFQRLENIPQDFSEVILAEDHLDYLHYERHERGFSEFFSSRQGCAAPGATHT